MWEREKNQFQRLNVIACTVCLLLCIKSILAFLWCIVKRLVKDHFRMANFNEEQTWKTGSGHLIIKYKNENNTHTNKCINAHYTAI